MKREVITATLAFAMPGITCLANTHCKSEEVVYFSCPIVGSKKVVSLCGSKLAEENETWLQYRFGILGKVELLFPANRANSYSLFKGESHWSRGGHIDTVSFENKGVTYMIESGASSETDYYFQGVRVSQKTSDKTLSLSCATPSPALAEFRTLASDLFGY